MKRYAVIDESIDEMATIEYVATDTFGAHNPGVGCTFISPDGTFINIHPVLRTHEDLCDWIEDNLDVSLEYKDDEYFIREFQWIRLRKDPKLMIIELPLDCPFSSQWHSLEAWLNYCEFHCYGGCDLYISVCDDNTQVDVCYEFDSKYFTEDILNICKQYYVTGKLYS